MMFIGHFSVKRVIMMAFCIYDTVHLPYISQLVEKLLVISFNSIQYVAFSLPPFFCGCQCTIKFKTEFRTSVGWYFNNISANEI